MKRKTDNNRYNKINTSHVLVGNMDGAEDAHVLSVIDHAIPEK